MAGTRDSRIARLMAGLETPDDLTQDEQDHLHEDLLQFLQEEHSKCRKVARVVYQVTFECDVAWEEGEDEQDAISGIDIPEGGSNGSVYCENSFKIIEVHNPEEGE